MENSKHTPGPWKFIPDYLNNDANEENFGTIQSETDGYNVCEMCVVDNGEIDAANAKLCAAAPELLDALKAMVKMYDNFMGNTNTGRMKQAKQAIQKATL